MCLLFLEKNLTWECAKKSSLDEDAKKPCTKIALSNQNNNSGAISFPHFYFLLTLGRSPVIFLSQIYSYFFWLTKACVEMKNQNSTLYIKPLFLQGFYKGDEVKYSS